MLKGVGPLLAATLLLAVTACDMPWSQRDKTLTVPPDSSGDAMDAGALPPPQPGDEPLALPEVPPQDDGVEIEVRQEGDTLTVRETLVAPDGSSWESAVADDEQRRLDMEACYDYALAQVRRDEQIYADQNAGWSNINNDSRYAFMQEQQAGYGFKRQKFRLFDSCMESKGYNKL